MTVTKVNKNHDLQTKLKNFSKAAVHSKPLTGSIQPVRASDSEKVLPPAVPRG